MTKSCHSAALALIWAFLAGVHHHVRFVQSQVMFLEPNVCTDWTVTRDAYDAAMSVWTEPACYNYSYTFWGFQVGLPTPVNVTVRFGAAIGEGGAGDKSMQYFTDMIYSLCIANCPDEGAETCEVEYAPEGYPTKINIDMSRYIADETQSYTISGFQVVECEQGSLVDGSNQGEQEGEEDDTAATPAVTNRCADVQQLIADMDQASKQWSTINADCYNFIYERMSSEPVEVQVRSGVAMNDEMSIMDFMNLIQTDCVDRCMEEDPVNPMDYVCTVTFADGQGYPVLIQMDPINEGIDGAIEDHVRISDLTIIDCESVASDEPGSTTEEVPKTEEEPASEEIPKTDGTSTPINGVESTSTASRQRVGLLRVIVGALLICLSTLMLA